MNINLNSLRTQNAIANILVSVLFFGIMNIIVKYLSYLPLIEVVFFRAFFSCILAYLTLRKMKISIRPKNAKLIILRGLTGTLGLILYFYTLQEMPLASAVTIQYLAPLFATFFGGMLFQERVPKMQWMFLALAFVGVIMVKGFDTRVEWLDLTLGVVSAAMSGFTYNLIRRLRNDEPAVRIVFYFPLVSTIITLPLLFSPLSDGWVTPNFEGWLLIFALAAVTWVAQIYMTKAYQSQAPGYIAIFNYLGLFMAAAFGYFLFNEKMSLLANFGILTILVTVVLSTLYQTYFVKKDSDTGTLSR